MPQIVSPKKEWQANNFCLRGTHNYTKKVHPCGKRLSVDLFVFVRQPLPHSCPFFLMPFHPMTHPLLLTEIIDLIASFLNNKALSQCTQVSHHWHTVFRPSLWRVVSMHQTNCLQLLDRLTLHSTLVRSLTLWQLTKPVCVQVLTLPFPCLHTLDIKFSKHANEQSRIAVKDLIHRQGHLLGSISLQNHSRYIPMVPNPNIFAILEGCTEHLGRLHTLSLNELPIPLDLLEEKTRAMLKRLVSFTLQRVRYFWATAAAATDTNRSLTSSSSSSLLWNIGGSSDDDDHECVIQYLSIRPCLDYVDRDYSLIQDCQALRSLEWTHWPTAHSPLVNDLGKGFWPFLERLNLEWSDITDEDLADLL